DGRAEGELVTQKIQPDVLAQNETETSSGTLPAFAGMMISTEPVKAAQWAEGIEAGMKLKKRTGREVSYPAGPAYVGTYEGMDRIGRPAFYKILYVVRNMDHGQQRGYMVSFACPAETYLDYLVESELIFRSLRWIPPSRPTP